MDVAIATCRELPEPDPDAEPLAAALAEVGVRAEALAWDDPDARFDRARMTVIRSTWNYPRHVDAFLSWLDRTASVTQLVNPIDVVRWNHHKRYLVDLEDRGIPIVPTEVIPRGAKRALADVLESRGWREGVVIKPAVSAGSFLTMRCAPGDEPRGEEHLLDLLEVRDALVQPYMPSVEGRGERAIVWIDGAPTHAVRKSPRFGGESESVSSAAVPISRAEAELARRAVAAVPHDLLYARIDVTEGADGDPVLMELELIEPSLFFTQGPLALDRFVRAIERRLAHR